MEIWKDIVGFEGVYQVSNMGNVRTLPRIQQDKNGRSVHYFGRILKPVPNSSGYLRVELKTSGRNEKWFVHRLVASHFVPNPKPDEFTIVNHLDNDFLNNAATNLEWTNPLGNTHHALKQGRLARTIDWLANQRKALRKYDKPVIGYDHLTGVTYVTFDSIAEAGRNGYDAGCICLCCQGKRDLHKGLAWMYAGKDMEVKT